MGRKNSLFSQAFKSSRISLFHGDMRNHSELDLDPDILLLDAPYSKHVQEKSRKGTAMTDVTSVRRKFPWRPLSSALVRASCELASKTSRWTIVFCDDKSVDMWKKNMAKVGLQHIRQCVWLKKSHAPQFDGSRPAHAHESIELFHSPHRRVSWNGHGRGGAYEAAVVKSERKADPSYHPSTKPIALIQQLLSDFCNPDDLIVDPFAGLGKTLLAADALGLRAIGIEKEGKYLRRAASSLKQSEFDFGEDEPIPLRVIIKESPEDTTFARVTGDQFEDVAELLSKKLGRFFPGLNFDVTHSMEESWISSDSDLKSAWPVLVEALDDWASMIRMEMELGSKKACSKIRSKHLSWQSEHSLKRHPIRALDTKDLYVCTNPQIGTSNALS